MVSEAQQSQNDNNTPANLTRTHNFGTCEAHINKHCTIRDHSIDYDHFIAN